MVPLEVGQRPVTTCRRPVNIRGGVYKVPVSTTCQRPVSDLSATCQRPVSDLSRPVGDLSISGGVCIKSLCQRPVSDLSATCQRPVSDLSATCQYRPLPEHQGREKVGIPIPQGTTKKKQNKTERNVESAKKKKNASPYLGGTQLHW